MTGCRHVRDSNVAVLLQSSNTAYLDDLTDTTEPYDVNLLRSKAGANLYDDIPDATELSICRTTSSCNKTSVPVT